MVDVFISYKREERDRCEHFFRKFKALGLDVWFDVQLTAGKSFDLEIERVVKSAKAVVVLWSAASVDSEWVREEAGAGKRRDVLAAIRIADCDLPFGFGSTHFEDLHAANFADDDAAWLRVLKRVGHLTDRPGLADFSQALGRAATLLRESAERHPIDPLAGRLAHLADGLSHPQLDDHPVAGRSAPAPQQQPKHTGALQRTGPGPRGAAIENSLDLRDYADFLEVFAQSEEGFEARRHRRKLEDWAATNPSDLAAVTAFLRAGSFPALDTEVQTVADNLSAEAERARQLAFPVGTDPSAACAAAIARRSLFVRSFAIDLDLPHWPRPHMVAIPPGRFLMGSPDTEARWEGYDGEEEPRHDVHIDYVLALGRGPVTVDEFSAFITETQRPMGDRAFVLTDGKWADPVGKGWRDPGFPQGGDHPVTCVNWRDALAYVAWLNVRCDLTDKTDAYRLPSEAEWEYACRAETETPFSFGDGITTDHANFDGNSGYAGASPTMVWRRATTRVGAFQANGFGLYDMHGNVWEWCQDAWNTSYSGAPDDGAAWLTGDASRRVVRGGSWYVAPQIPRSAMRLWFHSAGRGNGIGFRLARTLSPT